MFVIMKLKQKVKSLIYGVRPKSAKIPFGIDWSQILGSDFPHWKSLRKKASGQKVLIATSTGGHLPGLSLESLVGVGLTLRNAQVEYLLCDEVLPACLMCLQANMSDMSAFIKVGPKSDKCSSCYKPAEAVISSLGFKIRKYSQTLRSGEIEEAKKIASSIPMSEIPGYRFRDYAVGEHALAGVLRFYARATVDGEPTAEPILRRYFEASLLTAFAFQRLIEQESYSAVVFHHGIYVPQGIIGEVCRKHGVKVVNWTPGYRKKCFVFSHGDTYHHTLMTEPIDKWENLVLTDSVSTRINEYLKSRWEGTQDWIWFHEKPDFNLANIASEVGFDPSKPCVGMLTNVMWDAQLHYPANAFPNMLEWVVTTIREFEKRPDLQLLIRIHPAEIRGTVPSRQPILAEIQKAFPVIPPNVFIIGPESRISTYVAMSVCNSVLIFGTKTGVELTSMGIPVIVAGEAWIRNKGMTIDACSVGEYIDIIKSLPLKSKLTDQQKDRARRYAFHFFFRRMIEIDCMHPAQGWPPYAVKIDSLNDLYPGRDRGLDVICDGILGNGDFVLRYEDRLVRENSPTQDLGNQKENKIRATAQI